LREPVPPPHAVPLSAIADVAHDLQNATAGEGGRVAVLAAVPALGDTSAVAIKFARLLAEKADVVLVGLDAGNSGIRAASSDANAKGLAELAAGSASFRDIITKDKQSSLHLISMGLAPTDRFTLLCSPVMATGFDALARSYEYVILDAGPAEGTELKVVAEIAPHAMLLAETLTDPETIAAHERLVECGFTDVTIVLAVRDKDAKPEAAAA
jgi:Mrp family chromosome partitioning ATPase